MYTKIFKLNIFERQISYRLLIALPSPFGATCACKSTICKATLANFRFAYKTTGFGSKGLPKPQVLEGLTKALALLFRQRSAYKTPLLLAQILQTPCLQNPCLQKLRFCKQGYGFQGLPATGAVGFVMVL